MTAGDEEQEHESDALHDDLPLCAGTLHARCRACHARNCCARNGVTVPQHRHETARVNFAAKIVNGDNARAMNALLFATILAATATATKPAPPPDAIGTRSGLAYRVLRKGTGTRHPKLGNTVVVHYAGWQTTGHRFDGAVLRGEPAEFPLQDVIAGWREGIQLLAEGERARLWIPENLAYKGQRGKPMGTLVFDVELLKIK